MTVLMAAAAVGDAADLVVVVVVVVGKGCYGGGSGECWSERKERQHLHLLHVSAQF